VREGDTAGPGIFRRAYRVPVSLWQEGLRNNPLHRPIDFEYDGQTHDLSTGVYVDDIQRTSIIDDPAHSLLWQDACSEEFDLHANPRGIEHNHEKHVCMVRFVGLDSKNRMQDVYKRHPPQLPANRGRLSPAAMYLGPHLHITLRLGPEITRRIAAAGSNFSDFQRALARPGLDIHMKCTLFDSLIVGALLSGLDSLPTTPADEERLERAMLNYGRRTLGRGGWLRRFIGDGDHDVTNQTIRHRLRLKPISTRLRIRRLK